MIFYLIDDSATKSGLVEIECKNSKDTNALATVATYNKKGYGVFWCPNLPSTPCKETGKIVRQASYVKDEDIKFWFVDIDEGNYNDSLSRIIKGPCLPTMIMETKKGFHAYWRCDGGTVANFTKIENRLIDYYKADPKAKDLVRLLRYPGYMHMKDPKNPVMIEQIHYASDKTYSENEMLSNYEMSTKEKRTLQISDKQIVCRYKGDVAGDRIWDKIKSYNQGDLLLRLSGTTFVKGETYELKRMSNGNQNVLVNGYSSGCFINQNGEIVADSGYGNNIVNWLKWPEYNHSWADIMQIIKEVMPEINI